MSVHTVAITFYSLHAVTVMGPCQCSSWIYHTLLFCCSSESLATWHCWRVRFLTDIKWWNFSSGNCCCDPLRQKVLTLSFLIIRNTVVILTDELMWDPRWSYPSISSIFIAVLGCIEDKMWMLFFFFLQKLTVSGALTEDKVNLHIKILEIRAVLDLNAFQKCLVGHTVALMSDGTTVVAYINKQSGFCVCLLPVGEVDPSTDRNLLFRGDCQAHS